MLLEAVRNGDLTEELALQHDERLTELKMRLLGDRVSRRTAWKIARIEGWKTTYSSQGRPLAEEAARPSVVWCSGSELRHQNEGGPVWPRW